MTTVDETPVEEPEISSRAAGGCVLAIAVGAAGGVVYAVPELGYTVAGALAMVGGYKARRWVEERRLQAAEEEPEETEPVDIVAVLLSLSQGKENVRLTQLQDATGLPDTKTVRTLLDEAGIRVRTGVRSGGKNGPGVHATDIPLIEAAPSEGCLCRSDANTNTNNAAGEEPEKGFRVEHTGQAGTTVYDLSETHHRHHKLTGARRG